MSTWIDRGSLLKPKLKFSWWVILPISSLFVGWSEMAQSFWLLVCLSVSQVQLNNHRTGQTVGQYIFLYLVGESVYQSLDCLLVDRLLGLSVCQSVSQMQLSNQWTGQTIGQNMSISSLWVSLPITRLSVSRSFAGSVCLSIRQPAHQLLVNWLNGWRVYLSICFVSQFTNHWTVSWSIGLWLCLSVCQSGTSSSTNEPVGQFASISVYVVCESVC